MLLGVVLGQSHPRELGELGRDMSPSVLHFYKKLKHFSVIKLKFSNGSNES